MTSLAFRLAAFGLIAPLGCSSGTSGSGGVFDGPATNGDPEPSTTSGATTSDTDEPEHGTSSSSSDGGSAHGESSTGTLDDSRASLSWSVGSGVVEYGNIPVDTETAAVVIVENTGGRTATSLAVGTIPGDFSFPGGYPGTNGTCGTELAAGDSCTVELRFGPTRVGLVESELALEYYDGVDLGAPTQTSPLVLRGGGQGTTGNLLDNGDAESGDDDEDVTPWAVPTLQASWVRTDDAFSGTRAFTPTGALGGVAALDQTASIAQWSHETSRPGLRYEVRARVRSNGTHAYRMYIDFADGTGFVSLTQGTNANWTLVDAEDLVPSDATQATLRIECANNELGAAPCEVRFDDISLELVYP